MILMYYAIFDGGGADSTLLWVANDKLIIAAPLYVPVKQAVLYTAEPV